MNQQHTESKKSPPVVPARNDLDEAPVDFSGWVDPLDNQDPNTVLQFVSTKPNHPQYVGRYLVPRRIETTTADGKPGKPVVMAPWETVKWDDPAIKQGLARADQGVPIDNVYRRGTQVLIRTTRANAELATKACDDEVAAQARSMRIPQRTKLAGGITVTAAMMSGDVQDENELRDLVEKKGPR